MQRFIFPEWTQTFKKWVGLLALGGPVYLVCLIAYGVTPDALRIGYEPVQPVPYSHALHAGEARDRLSLLPLHRRARRSLRGASGGDVHELSLEGEGGLRRPLADSPGLQREHAGEVDAGPRPAGLRLLQSHGARERRDRLRDLPRPHRSDGARVPGQAADDGVVRELPPQPRALPSQPGERHQDGLRAPRR